MSEYKIGEVCWFSTSGRDGAWWDKQEILSKEQRRTLFGKKKWFYLVRWGYEPRWYPEKCFKPFKRKEL